MFPDGCDNNSCSLLARLFHEQPAHYGTVVIVQVADGLVQEDKVERLAKAADKSDALLLPEGKLAGSFVGFVGNAGCFEKGENFFFLLMVGQAFSRAVSSGKIRSSWKRMLSECFLISAHSPTENERMLRPSKLMMPW